MPRSTEVDRAPGCEQPQRGRNRPGDRRGLNVRVRKFHTGTDWRDVPEQCEPRSSPRFRRREADGAFMWMLETAQAQADATGTSTGRCRSTPPSSARCATALAGAHGFRSWHSAMRLPTPGKSRSRPSSRTSGMPGSQDGEQSQHAVEVGSARPLKADAPHRVHATAHPA
jgi:hypothetical protein